MGLLYFLYIYRIKEKNGFNIIFFSFNIQRGEKRERVRERKIERASILFLRRSYSSKRQFFPCLIPANAFLDYILYTTILYIYIWRWLMKYELKRIFVAIMREQRGYSHSISVVQTSASVQGKKITWKKWSGEGRYETLWTQTTYACNVRLVTVIAPLPPIVWYRNHRGPELSITYLTTCTVYIHKI